MTTINRAKLVARVLASAMILFGCVITIMTMGWILRDWDLQHRKCDVICKHANE